MPLLRRTGFNLNTIPAWLAGASVALLLAVPAGRVEAQKNSSAPCAGSPPFYAAARPDNDLSYFLPNFSKYPGQRVPIPGPVGQKILALAAEACFHLRTHSNDSLSLDQFFSGVYAIRSPDKFWVYAFGRGEPEIGWSSYFFILYDSTNGRITPAPVQVLNSWGEDDEVICRRPFVSFDDVDGDGKKELVVRERTHNGTSYNACVRHYFNIGSDLSLSPKLAIEERSYLDVGPDRDEEWVVREVRRVSPDSLAITTYDSVVGRNRREVGEVLLTKHGRTNYTIINTRVEDSGFDLISDGTNDEKFIICGDPGWPPRPPCE